MKSNLTSKFCCNLEFEGEIVKKQLVSLAESNPKRSVLIVFGLSLIGLVLAACTGVTSSENGNADSDLSVADNAGYLSALRAEVDPVIEGASNDTLIGMGQQICEKSSDTTNAASALAGYLGYRAAILDVAGASGDITMSRIADAAFSFICPQNQPVYNESLTAQGGELKPGITLQEFRDWTQFVLEDRDMTCSIQDDEYFMKTGNEFLAVDLYGGTESDWFDLLEPWLINLRTTC